jgi:putative addiction module component (TIGR02574 family)
MAHAAEILEAALKLDEAERSHLLEALAASLYGHDLGSDWEGEIQRRIEELDAGKVAPIPGDEVFAQVERRLSGR